jgi:hypothetical protein
LSGLLQEGLFSLDFCFVVVSKLVIEKQGVLVCYFYLVFNMRIKSLVIFFVFTGIVLASNYIPASQTSSGKLYWDVAGVYNYLYRAMKSVCLLSGLFLTAGGFYQYSQYRKDPVSVPFTKVLVMFICAFCALGLVYFPGVVL